MDNVVVLAGTKWQIPLIKRLRYEGYRVVDFNLYPDSPAFQYADEACIVDILDCKSCLEYCKQLNPKAIMSEECDIAVPTVAWLSEQLGLKNIGIDIAELYTNKYRMREFGKENQFETPFFYKCSSIEQALEAYEKFGKKMIMKPLDSNSSRGVYTVNSKDDIIAFWDKTVGFSKVEKSVLLEEYIDGVEFTIDGIKTENGHVSLAISEKKHYEYNENIACTLYFTYENEKFDYDELRAVNDRFVNLSGLPFGFTHAEYKYKDGKFYLIEIGARGGGNLISAVIVPLVSGVDNYNYLINKTIGKECDENISILGSHKERCAILQFFDVTGKSGVVKEIKGEEYLKNCKQIVDYCLYFGIGDRISQAEDDSKRIGYYIAYGENEIELQNVISQVKDSFEIILEENADERTNS